MVIKMPKDTPVQIRVDSNLKRDAENIFNAMGIKMSDAVRMFLAQSVNEGGLPFKPRAYIPNEKTLKAIDEADSQKTTEVTFDDADDLSLQWENY